MKMKYTDHSKPAPITREQRRQIKTDVADIRGAAKRKQVTLDSFEVVEELAAADVYFEVGCWLFYYSTRVGKIDGFQDRVNCARLLFDAEIYSPGYRFFTIFDFGERTFDTIFEMGDGDEVVDALRPLAARNPRIRKGFEHFGWSLTSDRQASLAL